MILCLRLVGYSCLGDMVAYIASVDTAVAFSAQALFPLRSAVVDCGSQEVLGNFPEIFRNIKFPENSQLYRYF